MCDLKAEMNLRTPKTLRVAGTLSRFRGCVCNYQLMLTPLAAAPRSEPAAQKRFASLSGRALRRAVLPHRDRHSPALHFASLRPRAGAGLRKATSAVRALDCDRQRAGADAAARLFFLIFIF